MRKNKIIFFLFLVVFAAGFLRFFKIDSIPPGLYIDEVSIGYNAYSILKEGRDEHGQSYPIFFEAFGEYKLPVYIYLTSGSIALFGKNDFAVRFPSALFGTLTVLILYLFIRKLLNARLTGQKFSIKTPENFALLTSFILALSPWHIHFSRGGFEVTAGLFFFLSGCLLLLMYRENRNMLYLFGACLLFVFAMYTYNSYRFLSPLVWFSVSLILLWKLPQAKKTLIGGLILFVFLSISMIYFSFGREGSLRFKDISAFSDIQTNNEYEKPFLYPAIYIKNYLSYFSTDFLFIRGDFNGRHQVPGMGLFFRWEFIFFIIGIIWLLRQNKSVFKYVVIGIFFLSPIIPALTRPSPHSLRVLLSVLPVTIFIACGIWSFYGSVKKYKIFFVSILFFIALYELILYTHLYYFHYPNVNALDWGAGYRQTVLKAELYKNQYDFIAVDKNLPFIKTYFQFYTEGLSPQYSYNPKVKHAGDEENILYIREVDNSNDVSGQLIDHVYLPGPKKDVFTQFWKL